MAFGGDRFGIVCSVPLCFWSIQFRLISRCEAGRSTSKASNHCNWSAFWASADCANCPPWTIGKRSFNICRGRSHCIYRVADSAILPRGTRAHYWRPEGHGPTLILQHHPPVCGLNVNANKMHVLLRPWQLQRLMVLHQMEDAAITLSLDWWDSNGVILLEYWWSGCGRFESPTISAFLVISQEAFEINILFVDLIRSE